MIYMITFAHTVIALFLFFMFCSGLVIVSNYCFFFLSVALLIDQFNIYLLMLALLIDLHQWEGFYFSFFLYSRCDFVFQSNVFFFVLPLPLHKICNILFFFAFSFPHISALLFLFSNVLFIFFRLLKLSKYIFHSQPQAVFFLLPSFFFYPPPLPYSSPSYSSLCSYDYARNLY